ncbi:MAG TPA: cell division protein FtsA [Bacteroidales bacterium]|nr:cell division protein FtsA [Bacteroidales bacterium]HSA44389.1 cell division protein FtsA [Bacteroidales bacterium]
MESSDIIVGLDIGTTKIAVIVGRYNQYGKIDILGYGKTPSIGVVRGVVYNIEDTVNSITEAVRLAEAASGVEIRSVYVGIAGQHIKSQHHRGSYIRPNGEDEIIADDIDRLHENMYKLMMPPGEEIIQVIAQEFIVDGEQGIKQPIGMCGVSLEANFHIITGQTAAVKNIFRCIKRAGLEVTGMMLEPLASSSSVLSEEEKEAGVVLVDIGGGTTDIAIFQDGIIRHTAVIPFGGNVVTEDIREGCHIIRKHAEELKVKFGSCLATENKEEEIVAIPGLKGRPAREISLKNLARIIEARMEEIIHCVINEIRNSGYERKLIGGIVLTGGGAMMKHIAPLTEFVTGFDTRIGYPNEHLGKESPDDITSPMYATGIGLVYLGLEKAERERRRKGMETMFADALPENNGESTDLQGEETEMPLMSGLDENGLEKQEKSRKKAMRKREQSRFGENFFKKITQWFEEDEDKS